MVPNNSKESSDMLMQAVSFASRAHEGQFRKDGKTPYASHPFRVCLTLVHVFKVIDAHVLTAAVLHDTIEDTTTDYDDIEKKFGEQIARWVGLLSKDKRITEAEREPAYMKQLEAAPAEVKLIKLADIYDNVMDARAAGPEQLAKSLNRSKHYLQALKRDPSPSLSVPLRTVETMLKNFEQVVH